MTFAPIYIGSYDCLTPAGVGLLALAKSLCDERTHLGSGLGSLPDDLNVRLQSMALEKPLRDHDKITLMGVHLARQFTDLNSSSGVIVGSSRGAASSIESSIQNFLQGKRLKSTTSPVTTASGLSSAIARDRGFSGPAFTLSAACSTGLYAVIQGAASLQVGLAESLLVGGVEAANTDFTQEMMGATRVLSTSQDDYPCKPGSSERSGMILSEGAAFLSLFREPSNSTAALIGVGAATESSTLTGVTQDGLALQAAITKAFVSAAVSADDIDVIVGHGAGTVKGDEAELNAYERIFDSKISPLVFHKWCGGHMLGASAALSVMLAIHHLQTAQTPPHPYFAVDHPQRYQRRLARSRLALVTSMGFGGSACAVIVKNLIH